MVAYYTIGFRYSLGIVGPHTSTRQIWDVLFQGSNRPGFTNGIPNWELGIPVPIMHEELSFVMQPADRVSR